MKLTIALAGNPNCGKTTMFNNLTGSHQHVGNWPGVTVERKSGIVNFDVKRCQKGDVEVVDLPGTYSLSPFSRDEVVAADYLVDGNPDCILNIVDGTNLNRNLYLTTQLVELGIPVVIAINMIDVVKKRGDSINIPKLSAKFGVPVVEVSAISGDGLKTAIEACRDAVEHKLLPARQRIFSDSVENALSNIEKTLPQNIDHIRFLAVKVFERDERIVRFGASDDARKAAEPLIETCEKLFGDDAVSQIADGRFDFIDRMLKEAFHQNASRGVSISDKIDKVVTNRIFGLPIFFAIMFVLYWIAVTGPGTWFTDWTNDTLFGEWIMPWTSEHLAAAGASELMVSLVVDGIIGGLGAVLGFVPQMMILFLLLSILEDIGYMARIAFMLDGILRRFGLSGRSMIPLLISSGCGVPGIMTARSIKDDGDRRATIMTATFVPCSAKLPLIALISGIILGGSVWMAPFMYFIGVVAVLVSSVILRHTGIIGRSAEPFVMELPDYHVPTFFTILMHMWDRIKGYLKKVGTILFAACVIIWFLASFGFHDGTFGLCDTEESIMAWLGGLIAPIFTPLGFGRWDAVAASISGFAAKESIVSTIGILSGAADATEEDAELWSAAAKMFPTSMAAFSFLLFNLLNSPCLAAVSTMWKELDTRKWAIVALVYQNVFAWLVSLVVYQMSVWIVTGAFTGWTFVAVLVLVAMVALLCFRLPWGVNTGKEKKAKINTQAAAAARG